jgi:hypothetical protein
MKAIDSPFTKIINGTTQFVIPVFQRDYTWDAETQCAQLWRDVLRAARTGGERGHFLGSIVYVATGDSLAGFTRWMLIDGQQRLSRNAPGFWTPIPTRPLLSPPLFGTHLIGVAPSHIKRPLVAPAHG